MAHDVSTISLSLQGLQVSRKFIIGSRTRQTNACGALVRVAIGFSGEQEEEQREKTRKRAVSIVASYFAGKPLQGEDADIANKCAADLSAVASALKPMLDHESAIVKEMEKLAKQLPVYSWVEGVRGFGARALAVLVGEAGDISNYPHPRMLYKRLGLMPVDGLAMSNWRFPNRRHRELSKDEWINAGYKPRRRAEIHALIAEPMSKLQLSAAAKTDTEYGSPRGPYGAAYIARREKTKISHPDWTKGHSRDDALRIMTKQLVSDLWSEWRREHSSRMDSSGGFAPADLIAAE